MLSDAFEALPIRCQDPESFFDEANGSAAAPKAVAISADPRTRSSTRTAASQHGIRLSSRVPRVSQPSVLDLVTRQRIVDHSKATASDHEEVHRTAPDVRRFDFIMPLSRAWIDLQHTIPRSRHTQAETELLGHSTSITTYDQWQFIYLNPLHCVVALHCDYHMPCGWIYASRYVQRRSSRRSGASCAGPSQRRPPCMSLGSVLVQWKESQHTT